MARTLAGQIGEYLPEAEVACQEDESLAGGGSLPLTPFRTWVVSVRLPGLSCTEISADLRGRAVPIICRVRDDALIFDCRTLSADDIAHLAGALAEAARDLSAD